jgi:hypothetical protein
MLDVAPGLAVALATLVASVVTAVGFAQPIRTAVRKMQLATIENR